MKKVKDLKVGDTFQDSFGNPLKVERTEALEWLGIPRTAPKIRIFFMTERGTRMWQDFSTEREVEMQNPRGAQI